MYNAKIKIDKKILIAIAFFLITIGNSKYFVSIGIGNRIVEAGLAVLILGILYNQCLRTSKLCKKIFITIVIFSFLCIGILLQAINVEIKLNLTLSMFILVCISVISEGYIDSIEQLRVICYSIITGMLFTFILAVATDTSVLTVAFEGLTQYGFDCGMEHKNYYAYDVIACITILIVCRINNNKCKNDWLLFVILTILLLLSNSRSAYITVLVVLAVSKFSVFEKARIPMKIKPWYYLAVLMACCFVGVVVFMSVAVKSETYMHRINGMINYLNYVNSDEFHLWFGNAEMLFGNSGKDYVENFRINVGWNGTVEMSYLNMLLKNGIMGVIGYSIIICNYISKALWSENHRKMESILVVLISFLFSGLSETFMVNMHLTYGIVCYFILAGLSGYEKNRRLVNKDDNNANTI